MIRLNHKILLLSGPVGSGKSTRLMAWQTEQPAAGFITPVVNGSKMLYVPGTGEYFPFEIDHAAPDSIVIGRYLLDGQAFKLGAHLLQQALKHKAPLVCIDEIGKLELAGAGFHTALAEFFSNLACLSGVQAVITVRDYLLRDVIAKYRLHDLSNS